MSSAGEGHIQAPLPENLALKAKATASEDFGPQLRPEFAIDGNPLTRWSGISGHNSGVWFQLEWPKPVTLRQLVIQQYDTFVMELDVQVWDEARQEWRTLQHFGKPGEKLPLVVVATFDAVQTTKARIANITNGPSFTEVEAYSEPMPPVTVLGSDVRGNAIGIVCDRWGRSPVSGASVHLSGQTAMGPWNGDAVSDEHGLFGVPLPLGLHGPLSIQSHSGAFDWEQVQPSEDLQRGLTPVGIDEKVTSLNGQWRFSIDPPDGFEKPDFDDSKWSDITVPGHWEMQGFRSLKGIGGYRKRFVTPGGSGRVKLRFDGVYSGAEVWLNGARVAYHEGGALPFEVDVTDHLAKGENVLALRVCEHTAVSDLLDHMSNYADVPLAGIMRKVTLFRVPETHVGAYAIATPFGPGYRNATIEGTVSVDNERGTGVSGSLALSLTGPDGKPVPVPVAPIPFQVGAWTRTEIPVSVPVAEPMPWNAEQPNLYRLTFDITENGNVLQSLTRRVGFRQTEIKGTQILVDGKPIKIRGTCHHDSDPLLGRAVTPEIEKHDLELMKEANLNAIRTSHYPPLPELIDFADELGVYVEDEGSFCWTGATDDLRLTPRVMQMNCELVARDRNHPSVAFWSICNESDIGYGLWRSREWIQKADPSRPTTGSYHTDEAMDIAVRHNPYHVAELDEVEKNVKVPAIWDECWGIWQDIFGDYAELWIDPGLRDYYITKLPPLYERFMRSPVLQGTQIWAWSDDTFLLPNAGVEYGRDDTRDHYDHEQYDMPGRGVTGDAQWGVVDGWRRRKPEFWHTKKLHSPVKVKEAPLPMPAGTTVEIPVENQYDFLNLSDLKIEWRLGKDKGTGRASVNPHEDGTVVIELPRKPSEGEALGLDFRDSRGVVDTYLLPFGKAPSHEPDVPAIDAKPLESYGTNMLNGKTDYVVGNGFEIGFGEALGYLRRGVGFGCSLLRSAPMLHLSQTGNPTRPLPDPLSWKATGVDLVKDGSDYTYVVSGEYTGFTGTYEYTVKPNGEMVAKASFVYDGDDVKIRELGLAFQVPKAADLLRWSRRAEYTVYPADHIGRAVGETRAFKKHDLKLPPTWSWSDDDSAMGCNDFRSTKRNVYWGWIGYPDGGPGVLVKSDGTQNFRATVRDDRIEVLVTDFMEGAASRWEWTANYGDGRTLKRGDKVECAIHLRLVPGTKTK
jgi:hypothetical protein